MLEILNPTSGHFWLALGLVLIILEAVGGAFVLLSLGVGAMVTAIPAYIGLDHIGFLLGIFAAASLVAFATARRIFQGLEREDAVKTNMMALVGREGVVTQPVRGTAGPGYAKVQGQEWRSICPSGAALETGTEVLVLGHEGVTLQVEPKE